MEKVEGIKQILNQRWWVDEYNTWNLVVKDKNNRDVKCYVSLRPNYCDRGHIQLIIVGPLNLDHADTFPRYFFSAMEVNNHVRLFLLWRLWEVRNYPHNLSELENCKSLRLPSL